VLVGGFTLARVHEGFTQTSRMKTMIQWDSDAGYVKACVLSYLDRLRMESSAVYFFEGLKEAAVETVAWDGLPPSHEYPNGTRPKYHLIFKISLGHYDEIQADWFRERIEQGLRVMGDLDHMKIEVSFKVLPGIVPSTESGLNNCFFKTDKTILHDELRFRSKAEVCIYDELKRRNVLIFPNPAAVLGRQEPEQYEMREPDFLICHRGKWGILEVAGEPYHSGSIATAKDHDRARLFQRYGLVFVQVYDSKKCEQYSAEVVDNFLMLLAQAKL
jgi:hypothetical protein